MLIFLNFILYLLTIFIYNLKFKNIINIDPINNLTPLV